MNITHPTSTLICLLAMCSTNAISAPQDVHINSVLVHNNGGVHLINNSPDPIRIDGWRFITTDESGINMQSNPHALDGIVLSPHLSVSIQIDNNENLGPFADRYSEAFVVSLFFPDDNGEVSFDNPAQMADHLQWSTNGNHHPVASEHSQLAVDAGLWIAHDGWIDAPEHIYLIETVGDPTSILHGPEDYSIIPSFCRVDINHDGNINFFDVSAFLAAFSIQNFEADMNNDNEWNFFDVSIFLNMYTTDGGCK
jgi:hypothetical protein